MALNISLVKTTRTSASEPLVIPDDVAKDLQDTYEALVDESPFINARVEFATADEARLFARQARAWAAVHGKNFSRKGSVKDNPLVVLFRVYDPTDRKGGPGRKATN